MSSKEAYLDDLLASVMEQKPEKETQESMETDENPTIAIEEVLEPSEDSLDLDVMDGDDVDLSTLEELDEGIEEELEEGLGEALEEDLGENLESLEEDLEEDLGEALDLDALDENAELHDKAEEESNLGVDLNALDLDLDVDALDSDDEQEATEQPEMEQPLEAEEAEIEDTEPFVAENAEDVVSEENMDAEIDAILNSVTDEINTEDSLDELTDKLDLDDEDSEELSHLDEEMEMDEISGLLDESDEDEDDLLDALALAPKVEENVKEAVEDINPIEPEKEEIAQPPVEENESDGKKAKKEKSKKQKVKKEKREKKTAAKEKQDTPKAGNGFFARFFKAMTEEDVIPEPTEEELKAAKEAKEAKKQEAAQAKESKKKEKEEEKEAKKKEKEEAKAQKAKEAEEKKKAKAEAKAAKLAQKQEQEKGKKKKYVSKKKVALIGAFAATVLVCILLLENAASTHTYLKRAREAFYTGDYESAYLSLYGEKLNESDTILYEKSKMILKMERKLESYVNNLKMGRELEALNALLQGVAVYERNKEEAVSMGVSDEVDNLKNRMILELANNYALEESDIHKLLQIQDENSYTKILNHIIMGEDAALMDIESIISDEKSATVQEESPYTNPEMIEEPDFDEELKALDTE